MSLLLLFRNQAVAVTGTVDVEFGFETEAVGSVEAVQQQPQPETGGPQGGTEFFPAPRLRKRKPITGICRVAFGSETHAVGEVLPGDELWVLGLDDEEFAA